MIGDVIPFRSLPLSELRARARAMESGNVDFIAQDLLSNEAAESVEAMVILLGRQHLQQKNMIDTLQARGVCGVTSLMQAWVKTCDALADMEFLLESHRKAVVAQAALKRKKH